MASRFALIALILLAITYGSPTPAKAVDVRPGQAPADIHTVSPVAISASVFEPVTANYNFLTPAFGGATLGILPDSPLSVRSFNGMTDAGQDFAASYLAQFNSGQLGIFGGYNSVANLYETAPTTGWNFGASVGYAGFYLRAGMSSDATGPAAHLFDDANRGWLAGVGYQTGALNLRVTYMAAQPIGLVDRALENDKRLWMIGGIYQLTPRIRFNADAFTSSRNALANASVFTAPVNNTATPQGTGARVGVQLKF